MAVKPGPALLLGGAIALLLLSKKKGGLESLPAPPDEDDSEEKEPPVDAEESYESLVAEWEDSLGRAMLGKLYQVKEDDTPLGVAREALFGSREPRIEPWERQAVIDLSVRMDCGPWNQTSYGRGPGDIESGHVGVENGWAKMGVSFMPIFHNNRERLMRGMSPTAAPGHSFPYMWIPMIDVDVLDIEHRVTTLGQNWPDDGGGEYSMINPPPWVIDLEFEEVASLQVGCDLPEGDFRKTLEPK